jgi:nuclear mRNA export protein PCID2/THP1
MTCCRILSSKPSNSISQCKYSYRFRKCSAALQNDPYGVIILPTVLEYSAVLARLAIGLDKRPELISHLTLADEGTSSSLPELAAMSLRQVASICARDLKPNGKSSAVYKLANLCMKILFQCQKPESIPSFYNIVALLKRPITDYSRGDRVTYLFYLGRYFHYTAQFYYAVMTLERAYLECDIRCLKQRRLILIYLVASGIILGRFPSKSLYQRPEAAGFEERFDPICQAMKLGDLATFRVLTSLDSYHADWFLYFGILLQIQTRGEVTVWRSLARRTFAIRSVGASSAEVTTNAKGQQVAATLDLNDLYVLSEKLAIRALSPTARSNPGIPGKRHTNWVLVEDYTPADLPPLYIDPDFEGLSHEELGITKDQLPPQVPTLAQTECWVASLITQKFMVGYISHRLLKFAIKGGRTRPALQAGWPPVWAIIQEKFKGDVVPGLNLTGSAGGGMTIHLSGAAPAGS